MRLKSGLKLRELGGTYMIVEASSQVNLTNVYTLNAIAADIWKFIGVSDFTLSQVATYVCGEYEVDYDSALRDIESLIDDWQTFGLVIND